MSLSIKSHEDYVDAFNYVWRAYDDVNARNHPEYGTRAYTVRTFMEDVVRSMTTLVGDVHLQASNRRDGDLHGVRWWEDEINTERNRDYAHKIGALAIEHRMAVRHGDIQAADTLYVEAVGVGIRAHQLPVGYGNREPGAYTGTVKVAEIDPNDRRYAHITLQHVQGEIVEQ